MKPHRWSVFVLQLLIFVNFIYFANGGSVNVDELRESVKDMFYHGTFGLVLIGNLNLQDLEVT